MRRAAVFAVAAIVGAAAVVSAQPLAAERPEAARPRACIRPSLVRTRLGGTCRFRVVLDPSWLRPARVAGKVEWSVDGVRGGNSRVGTIDAAGLYKAPAKRPVPCEVHVRAVVPEADNRVLCATVLIGSDRAVYVRVARWDEPADGTANLKDPVSIAVAPDGALLIADYGKGKVWRYTSSGKCLGALGGASFDNPTCVAVDARGSIYVSDLRTGPPRIRVFGANGKLEREFAPKGVGPGQVMLTRGMGFDRSGRLFAADAETMRVNVYARDGAFLDTWDRSGVLPGEMHEPYGLVVDPNGDVFVAGFYGPCQKFTGRGAFLLAFAHPDPPDGPVVLTSAAGDRWGNVYLAVRGSAGMVHNTMDPEPRSVRMRKYNNNGDLVAEFALWDDEKGENGAAVDGAGRLYVLYKRAGRAGVAVFEPR